MCDALLHCSAVSAVLVKGGRGKGGVKKNKVTCAALTSMAARD